MPFLANFKWAINCSLYPQGLIYKSKILCVQIFEMDRLLDLVTDVKGRLPKNLLDVEIPEKIRNPPLWLKVH